MEAEKEEITIAWYDIRPGIYKPWPWPLEKIRVIARYRSDQKKRQCPLRQSDGRCSREPKYPGAEMAEHLTSLAMKYQMCTACWQLCCRASGVLPVGRAFQDGKSTQYVVPHEQIQLLERRRKAQIQRHPDLLAVPEKYSARVSKIQWEAEGEQRSWYPIGAELLLLKAREWNDLPQSK